MQRLAFDLLLPAGERIAWMQALVLDLVGFAGIARPPHGSLHFRPKPEDIAGMQLRDGDRQHAARHIDHVGELRPLLRQAIGHERFRAACLQLLGQHAQAGRRGRGSGGEDGFIVKHGGATGAGERQPGVGVRRQAALKRFAGGDLGEQFAFDALELDAPGGIVAALAAADML
jgi:hypothetical protein